MSTWKKTEIREVLYSIQFLNNNEVSASTSVNSEVKLQRTVDVIKNPSEKQLWFYYVKKNNVQALEEMLKEGVIDINERDDDGDEMIAHHAITRNSMKLIDFCLYHHADFFLKSRFDDETAFYNLSYYSVGLKIFKKLCNQFGESVLLSRLWEENAPGKSLIYQLCSRTENLKKVQWLDKEYPNLFEKLQKDSANWNNLISSLEKAEKYEFLYVLQGLQKINNHLKDTLTVNASTNKRMKI